MSTPPRPAITAQCLRVPVTNGHMAAVFVTFDAQAQSMEEIKADLGRLPAAARRSWSCPPRPGSSCTTSRSRTVPRRRLDRDLEGGMAVSIGRLRPDTQYDL